MAGIILHNRQLHTDGSTPPPGGMIAVFLFYNHGMGKLNRFSFSKDFKHCNVITYQGSTWNQVTWSPYGIHIRPVKVTSIDSFFRSLRAIRTLTACVVVEIIKPHVFAFSPFGVHSCNELSRYTAGVNIGYTFNPRGLYKKLLKYDKIRNYTVLKDWRR